MTWSINLGGHEQPWDEDTEKAVADIGRKIVDELKSHGLSSARFTGNYYREDYLAPTEEAEA